MRRGVTAMTPAVVEHPRRSAARRRLPLLLALLLLGAAVADEDEDDGRFMVTIDASPRYLPGPANHASSPLLALQPFCNTHSLSAVDCSTIYAQYKPWFDEREQPLIEGCRQRFGFRTPHSGYGEMTDAKVAALCSAEGLLGGCEDLERFTGLTASEVRVRIRRLGTHHFEGEHLFRNPTSATELAWFYATSTTYIFANVIHPYNEPVTRLGVADGPVFDFSGGVGNNVLHLASRGVRSAYYGIGELEFQFTRARVARRGLAEMVDFYTPRGPPDFGLDRHAESVPTDGRFQTILAFDVLEHIPQYEKAVARLVRALKPGGLFIEHSPFDETATDTDVHVAAAVSMVEAMGDSMVPDIPGCVSGVVHFCYWRKKMTPGGDGDL